MIRNLTRYLILAASWGGWGNSDPVWHLQQAHGPRQPQLQHPVNIEFLAEWWGIFKFFGYSPRKIVYWVIIFFFFFSPCLFYMFIFHYLYIYVSKSSQCWLLLEFTFPLRNAYQEHCMGSYGGPVLPHVALGGFLAKNQTLSENPNYMLADTLVITLPINNFFNTSMLKPALAWEKVYVWLTFYVFGLKVDGKD